MSKLLKIFGKNNKSDIFDTWVKNYHGALYKHALWMTGSRESALDAVQETYFQAWLGIQTLKDKDKALPWLLTILRRSVYREQRIQYRHAETLAELQQLDRADSASDAIPLLQIYEAMEGLSATLRDTFLLHHLHGFSYEEIGAQLQIPKGTVMSRISRAREALAKQHRKSEGRIVNFRVNEVLDER